jgi:hypothetical protein
LRGFQATKNEVSLDHYQVGMHAAGYRPITLAMIAHAHPSFLAAAPRPLVMTPVRSMTASPHREPEPPEDHHRISQTAADPTNRSHPPSTRSACTPEPTPTPRHAEAAGHIHDAATKPAPATTNAGNASSIAKCGWSINLPLIKR